MFGFGNGTVSKCARLKSFTLIPCNDTLLLLVRCPFTVTSAVPRPAARTSVGSPVTPVDRLSRNRKFGDASGSVRNVCPSRAWPVVALEGLIRVAVASTLTVSWMLPGSSETSCRVVSVILTSTPATTAAFGSYSTVATFAGILNLSRLKSITR